MLLQGAPEGVGAGEVRDHLTADRIVGEMRRLHHRGRTGRAVDGQLPEVVRGEPVLPLGVVGGGVPGMNQHGNSSAVFR